jgi:hypothetical protein
VVVVAPAVDDVGPVVVAAVVVVVVVVAVVVVVVVAVVVAVVVSGRGDGSLCFQTVNFFFGFFDFFLSEFHFELSGHLKQRGFNLRSFLNQAVDHVYRCSDIDGVVLQRSIDIEKKC